MDFKTLVIAALIWQIQSKIPIMQKFVYYCVSSVLFAAIMTAKI